MRPPAIRLRPSRWMLTAAMIAVGIPTALGGQSATAADDENFVEYAGGTVTLTEAESDGVDNWSETDEAPADPVTIRCVADSDCALFGVEPRAYRGSTADGIPLTAWGGGEFAFAQQAVSDDCTDSDWSKFPGQLLVVASATDIAVSWDLECHQGSAEPELGPEIAPDPTDDLEIAPGGSDETVVEIDGSYVLGVAADPTDQLEVASGPSNEPEQLGTILVAAVPERHVTVAQQWTGTFVAGNVCLVDAAFCPPESPSPESPSPDTTTPDPERTETTTPDPGRTETTTPDPERTDTTTPDPEQTETTSPTPDPTETAIPVVAPPSWTAPSVLSDLSPVMNVGITPLGIGFAAAMAVILVLLIAFPTALLNSAVENAMQQREQSTDRRVPRVSGWWKAALGVALAALISGFVDPQFGVNEMSVRALASILIAFTIDVVIGWSVRIWLVRRFRPDEAVSYRFVPVTLLIVAGAVLLTRLIPFEPAIIFGLVAGVVFSSALTVAQQAHTELAGLGYGFAVALAAWLVYTLLPGQSVDPAVLFARETLAAAAIAGVAALPIVLFPVRGLPGYTVYRWRRIAWGVAYFAALFAFFVLLMPMPDVWLAIDSSLIAWTTIYVAYFVVAFGAWVGVKAWTRRLEVEPAQTRGS